MFLWPRLEAIVIVALKMFTFWGNLFKQLKRDQALYLRMP
jgi:hypothetical protein